MKKQWKIAIGAVLFLVLIFYLISYLNKGIEAEVYQIKPKDFKKPLKEEGTIVSSEEYPLYPVFSGKILQLPVKEGHRVQKGDLIATLDTEDLKFQLEELIAQQKSLLGEQQDATMPPYESEISIQKLKISQAKQDLDNAKIDFQRNKALYEADAISKSEFEDMENLLKAAENNYQRQQKALTLLYETSGQNQGKEEYYSGKRQAVDAQIRLLKRKIQKGSITSPIDGTIANLKVKAGEYVDVNKSLGAVFDDDSYEVEVLLLPEDVANIDLGMEARLIVEGQDKDINLKGTVKSIAPKATEMISSLGLKESRIKVTLSPSVPKNLKLYPGTAIDVEFILEKIEDQLILPKTAIFPHKKGDAVWIVSDGKAKVQKVKLGPENDRETVILEGLKKDDLVITNPKLKSLAEGKKIKITNKTPYL